MNYENIYKQIIDRNKKLGLDKTKLNNYYEKHHIVPVCVGGNNDDSNFVLLTAREHYICHKLLCKINKNNKKLQSAYCMMVFKIKSKGQKRDYKVSSREFEKAKINYSLLLSERMKGHIKSEETRNKLKIANTGVIFTEERKNKIRLKAIGRKRSKETIEKFIKSRTGKRLGVKLSIETRKKIKDNHHDVKGENNPMFGKKGAANGRVWVNNKIKNSYIFKEELENYLSTGFTKGMVSWKK